MNYTALNYIKIYAIFDFIYTTYESFFIQSNFADLSNNQPLKVNQLMNVFDKGAMIKLNWAGSGILEVINN